MCLQRFSNGNSDYSFITTHRPDLMLPSRIIILFSAMRQGHVQSSSASPIRPPTSSLRSLATTTITRSYYVEDGSFLKLRNIQLGYNVPKAFANKLAATPSAKQPPSPNPPGAKVTNYINKAISSSRQSNLTLPSS